MVIAAVLKLVSVKLPSCQTKGSIIITYDGKGSVIGSFNKEIVVNSNASNKYISLFVKGVNQ